MITVTKQDFSREIPSKKLEQYLSAGWVELTAKPSKKKKSEKTAESVPEAAQENLDNANQGE